MHWYSISNSPQPKSSEVHLKVLSSSPYRSLVAPHLATRDLDFLFIFTAEGKEAAYLLVSAWKASKDLAASGLARMTKVTERSLLDGLRVSL
jgi:hypothetical protein